MKNQNTNNFNVWNYKPWWCQPWSIISTGISIIAVSWLLFHTFWLSLIVAVPIVVWWIYFLGIYPQTIQKMHD